jgi:hypothetical protein
MRASPLPTVLFYTMCTLHGALHMDLLPPRMSCRLRFRKSPTTSSVPAFNGYLLSTSLVPAFHVTEDVKAY